jgi:beta-lactam-binding protein with PASTA domain
VRVPNVVGSDLQSAQERLFPPLRSTSVDASGQGRSQLVDANWIVVRQDPPAGTQVLPLTDITLYVLKRGEG